MARACPRVVVWLLVCGLAVGAALFSAAPVMAAPPPIPPQSTTLTPQPTTQDFGGVDIHWSQSTQEWFYNHTGSPVTVASVTILGDTASFAIQPGQDLCTGQTLQSGDGCRVIVVLGPLSSTGPKLATLELTDSTGSTAAVPLTANGLTGTLTATQGAVDFGSQVVPNNNNGGGGSQQQTVTVDAGPYFGARITNTQINGPDASSFSLQGNGCQGFIVNANGNCQIYIQFQPTSGGPKQAQLEIDNDGTASPLFVSLSGVGLNGPAVTVSPRQAIFGNIPLGSSTSQTLTLTNSGDAPLQLQELFIATGSPQVFPMSDGCSGRQLAPGAACQLTVGFIPIALGVKDASVFVLSNAAPVSIIGLSGTGVAPSAAFVLPRNLSQLRSSTVGEGACRRVSVAAYLPGKVHVMAPNPVTPWAQFALTARSPMQVSLDGRTLGYGSVVRVKPRMFQEIDDGTHTLQVKLARRIDRAVLTLAPCQLAARLQRSSTQSSVLTVSSRTGISSLTATLPPGLKIDLAQRKLGQVWFERSGAPNRSFALRRPRTVSGGVTVALSGSVIAIRGLPGQVGVIKLQLGNGVLLGRGGRLRVRATVSGTHHRLTISTS